METEKSPEISVIIPAYNESLTIGSVISNTVDVLKGLGKPYEILVVDDGSVDLTSAIAKDAGAEVIIFSHNRGKGYSLRRALQHAHGDIIVTIDADGENDPYEINDLIAPLIEGADVVSGSRFLGNRRKTTTKLNQIGNFFFNFTIMALTGKVVTDSQTGFRAIKRDVLEKLNLESDGYEIETEITVKSLKKGFALKEVPITVQPRKFYASKLRTVSDGFHILRTVFKAGLKRGI